MLFLRSILSYCGYLNRARVGKGKKGIAALPTVVVIALIVLVAGIGIVSTGLVENAITAGEDQTRGALYAAEAGVHDAIERIVRNKDCASSGTPSCASYSLAIGDATAAIAVSGGASSKTIISTGTLGNKTRQITTTVAIDINNKITVTGWAETGS